MDLPVQVTFYLRHIFAAAYVAVFLGVVRFAASWDGLDFWKRAGVFYEPGPWCERERTAAFVREPANAWSDFSFLAVGFYQIYCAAYDWLVKSPNNPARNPMVAYPLISLVSGVANCLHAVGTFTFHSCRCHEGHRMDCGFMFAVTSFPLFYNIFRTMCAERYNTRGSTGSATSRPTHSSSIATSTRTPPATKDKRGGHLLVGFAEMTPADVTCFIGSYVVVVMAFVWVTGETFFGDVLRDIMMGLLIVADLATFSYYSKNYVTSPTAKRRDSIAWGICFFFLAVAFACHTFDRKKIFCDPDSWVQGHAIWHVSCAVCLHFMYVSFRRENYPDVFTSFHVHPRSTSS
eukprot:TRINITY_DN11132_c0_g1_i1.p1 TRINITY_DN11132_c0_g1~~TRINITY_DN11132_c0_g1_i1.p1  ORF type:complete len:384 (+),score=31.54 TRINITY_DN11132_c0_g1_i1:113-1153(+)